MATDINVNIPVLQEGNILLKFDAKIANGTTEKGEIIAAMDDILPWASSASGYAFDFYLFSIISYGIDRFLPRRAHSVDGWSREINLKIPVSDVSKWTSIKNNLQELLSFLTGDYWSISFYKNSFALPITKLPEEYKGTFQKVSLFSGGLDSLIGAIDTLEENKLSNLFISHYDPLMHGPKKDQGDLTLKMYEKYGERFSHLPSIKVFLAKTTLRERETTSRSRSCLFIGLALLIADTKKVNIKVPENGTVSLNYPLSPSRRSSCSTRTTHPTFINLVEIIFQKLGILARIENPYKFKTKGEMVATCKNKNLLKQILAISNSCGKRGHRAHWDLGGTHCGICMPCIYRRAALTTNDKTEYGNNINTLTALLSIRKKWQDVGSMLDFLNEKTDSNKIKFELIANGLQDQNNLYNYINLVIRTRKELAMWIKSKGNTFAKSKAGV